MALTAKGRNQNSKITKLIIIVVLIVIIIIIIMITTIIISYHYQFLNQLKQMKFCCFRSFLSVFAYFFFIKARGSEANPTCKMSTTCSGSVNNWSAMWQKSSSNTLSSWLDPSSLFFPWKKKKKTNTYDNLAVHLFRHFRRKTFTFTSS